MNSETIETNKRVRAGMNQDFESETNKPRYFLTTNEISSAFGITPQAALMWMKHNDIQTFKHTNRAALSPINARKFFERRGFDYPIADLAIMALKGGSGKTSDAFNLAVRLNQYGARVLAFDTDMQGNLTDAFGLELEEDEKVLVDVLQGECRIDEIIRNINPGLDLVPSSFNNSALDYFTVQHPSDLTRLFKKILEPVRDRYDIVIFDCSPALNTINSAIALGSTQVIIPVNPCRFSRRGLSRTIKEFARLKANWDKEINYKLLYAFYDARESTSQSYLLDYGIDHRDKLFSTLIRKNAEVKNTIDRRQCIFDTRNSPAREDFDQLAREILGIKDLPKLTSN